MAILTTSKVGAGVAPRANVTGAVTVTATHTLSAALALGDVIQMVKVPGGATILGVTLSCTDLDTGGSPAIVLGVGDGASTARFIASSTVGQAGGVATLNAHGGHGYTYADDDTIDVLVATGPATGAASGTIRLTAIYTMDA